MWGSHCAKSRWLSLSSHQKDISWDGRRQGWMHRILRLKKSNCGIFSGRLKLRLNNTQKRICILKLGHFNWIILKLMHHASTSHLLSVPITAQIILKFKTPNSCLVLSEFLQPHGLRPPGSSVHGIWEWCSWDAANGVCVCVSGSVVSDSLRPHRL